MGTVLDEIPPLPPGWLRVSDHRDEWERLRAEAQDMARRLAALLVSRYGARRVWLYGSAVGEWVFHPRSDIDMAIEGLDLAAVSRAEGELQPQTAFPLDLRPREWIADGDWAEFVPTPILLAEREHEPDPRARQEAPRP